ncbi:MAG: glycosyltransferase family 4 protein [Bacteroidia bacterium]|nr:glycosyltransferase family 4 protein [Bacteroidia bacterium]
MKRVSIITSYYPPETGAASNRIYHLAEGLKDQEIDVSIITPMPNYPHGKIFKGYRGKFKIRTNENGITINRLWVFASNSKNKLLRLWAMLSYSLSLSWFFIFNKLPEVVIIQSPPLLVSFTCLFLLKSKKRTVVLNVSDLWPLAGLELRAFKRGFAYSLLERIEAYNYKTADFIMGQSDEILSHIRVIQEKPAFLYRNYPDLELVTSSPIQDSECIKLVYAGLLGIAQGILKLCQEIDYSGIELHIYGQGAEKSEIETFISNNPELPIYYHGEIRRSELIKIIGTYDLALIPLLNRIYGSVPSKIFELGLLGLPVLYFGGGEGEKIVAEHGLGWTAEAGNYEVLNRVLRGITKADLSMEKRHEIRATAKEQFNFKSQLERLMERLNDLV